MEKTFMKNETSDWLNSAKIDLGMIDKVIDDEFYIPAIAFHAQQVVEKSFKAMIIENDLDLIKTHDLERLWNIIKSHIVLKFDLKMLKEIDQVYTTSRYPGNVGLMPYGRPTLEVVQEFYEFAKDIYSQIEQTLTQTGN